MTARSNSSNKVIVTSAAFLLLALCAFASPYLNAEEVGPKDGGYHGRRRHQSSLKFEMRVPVAIKAIKAGDKVAKTDFKIELQKIDSSVSNRLCDGSDGGAVLGAKAKRDIPVGKIITSEDIEF
jgi:hypothetical protein